MFRISIVGLLVLSHAMVFASLGESQDLGLGDDKLVVVRPLPKEGALTNPLKGWCPYPNAGPISQPYSLVFQYISWKELEPEMGMYLFEEWEKKWESPEATGKHIVFRVYIDYPSKPSGLPDWLRHAGVEEREYEDYGGGLSPNYDHPEMIKGMEKLIEALGRRYNDNPRIAFVQLGLLGYWGEWHTFPSTKLYASPATEKQIIDAYRSAFPDKQLMVRTANRYAGTQDWIGFHDDLFPEDTNNGQDWCFMEVINRAGRSENWKNAVVGGEMVPGEAIKWLRREFDTTQDALEESHFSWIGPYCPALETTPDNKFLQSSQDLVRRMGYDFRIQEVTYPRKMSQSEGGNLRLRGENIGLAPFYYPWCVEFALVDDKDQVAGTFKTEWDIREWLPGEFECHAALNFDVDPGMYRLAVGIRDPWTKQPAIRFANQLDELEGWTILSVVEIEESPFSIPN